MARVDFAHADAATVNLWSKDTWREALKKTQVFKLMSKNKKNAVIQRVMDLEKNAGDTVKYDLLMQTGGAGVTGNNRLKGNEEALTYHQDTVIIDQLRQGHAFTRMSQQRSVHELRSDAKDNLADWWANLLDTYWCRYAGGDTTVSHGQAGLAPDTSHYVVCGDVSHSGTIATDEASLGSNDQIDLMDLDYAKEKARTITPMIRPTVFDGSEMYVAILHEYSLTDIRTSANSSATIKWAEIQRYANVRGLQNPIFSGALETGGSYCGNAATKNSVNCWKPSRN